MASGFFFLGGVGDATLLFCKNAYCSIEILNTSAMTKNTVVVNEVWTVL